MFAPTHIKHLSLWGTLQANCQISSDSFERPGNKTNGRRNTEKHKEKKENTRGFDVNKRTVTRHFYSLLYLATI